MPMDRRPASIPTALRLVLLFLLNLVHAGQGHNFTYPFPHLTKQITRPHELGRQYHQAAKDSGDAGTWYHEHDSAQQDERSPKQNGDNAARLAPVKTYEGTRLAFQGGVECFRIF